MSGRYDVAPLALKGVQDNELYIFTHPDVLPWLEKRTERFLSTYRRLSPTPQEMKREIRHLLRTSNSAPLGR